MRDGMTGFLKVVRELQKIDPEFPLQYAVCLAHISMNEGMSLTDLSDRTGLALSTVSRIVGAMSSGRRKGKSYGLLRVHISQQERRRREIYLTPEGRETVTALSGLLQSGPGTRTVATL